MVGGGEGIYNYWEEKVAHSKVGFLKLLGGISMLVATDQQLIRIYR